ncbi:hydroxyacid dehydrogenase [Aerococcus sanguinicola]|uniref:Hydroxyacid dehydrogenase n=1 Tax=Aerococcus sanguinicola TaxID=119206 RepID=A0A2I1MTU4_9LACT|nr:NAD(P)-dependent oxidoreductase [Aerococcus sanguinicola]PKZ23549.1 hydroxyacid dehydrogenase [Aerococcus sanguinicola]
MKINLLENLRVDDTYIEELAQKLKEAGHDFTYYKDRTTDPDELLARSQDADIVIIGNTPYPAEVIEQLDQTQLIDVAFTGVDHVDQEAAANKGIAICNASGYANQAVAELSLGLALSLFRQLPASNQDARKTTDFPGPIQGLEISQAKVGIIGTGAIGLATAKLYHALGAELMGYNRSEKEEAKALGMRYASLEEVMAESDIISIHLPATPETEGLISKEMIGKMKKEAILINVARGPIVDSQALADALNEEAIAGAGIDVFDQEPPLNEDEPLLSAKNTILTPHIGYLTDEAMVLRANTAFENALAFAEGQPQNLIK